MAMRFTSMAVVLVSMFVGGGIARADDNAEAKRLFMAGTKHFDLAEYDLALNDFKEGFRHKDDPVFLYNIAQCYRLLKNHEEDSLKFFQTYLRRLPTARNRDEVERKITGLQQVLAAQDRARSAPPSTTIRPGESPPDSPPPVVVLTPNALTEVVVSAVPSPRPKPLYKRWWLWTAVGGVVVVGVAVGLGVGLSQYNGTAFPKVTF